MKKLLFIPFIAILLGFGLYGNGTAAPIPYTDDGNPYDITDNNDLIAYDASAYYAFGQNSHPETLAEINANFGAGWEFLQKQNTPGNLETDDNDYNINLVVLPTSGTSSGTWAFNGGGWEDYIIVLKSGRSHDNGAFWYAYLLLDDIYEGKWNYPGTNEIGIPRNLSHLSVYGRGMSIPEPSFLILLGTGLVGLFVVRRKKNF